jgi:hypothetical protein
MVRPVAPAPGESASNNPSLLNQIVAELRWSFTSPWTWLTGVSLNLVLSLLFLAWVPLTGRTHSSWVIVVGTYFATFILADVTTTNALGLDAGRVQSRLSKGIPLRRILLIKNAVLLLIVGIPTLLLTGILTITSEDPYQLMQTLPNVALPIMAWLGVGNVVSVLFPVATMPFAQRWQQRRQVAPTVRWLSHLALPYALFYWIDPLGDVLNALLRQLPQSVRVPEVRGLLITLTGLALWLLGTVAATWIVRGHGRRLQMG